VGQVFKFSLTTLPFTVGDIEMAKCERSPDGFCRQDTNYFNDSAPSSTSTGSTASAISLTDEELQITRIRELALFKVIHDLRVKGENISSEALQQRFDCVAGLQAEMKRYRNFGFYWEPEYGTLEDFSLRVAQSLTEDRNEAFTVAEMLVAAARFGFDGCEIERFY